MTTFPQYVQILNFKEEYQAEGLRSAFDRGPAKQRPLTKRGFKVMTFTALICDGDYQSFVSWWRDDLRQGSDWFEFLDPSFNPAKKIRARFQNTVTFTGTPMNKSFDMWSLELSVEAYA